MESSSSSSNLLVDLVHSLDGLVPKVILASRQFREHLFLAPDFGGTRWKREVMRKYWLRFKVKVLTRSKIRKCNEFKSALKSCSVFLHLANNPSKCILSASTRRATGLRGKPLVLNSNHVRNGFYKWLQSTKQLHGGRKWQSQNKSNAFNCEGLHISV